MANGKQQVQEILAELPDELTAEQIVYQLNLHLKILRGLADVEAGRTTSTEEIERRFGLKR